jgi:hypothetical protein
MKPALDTNQSRHRSASPTLKRSEKRYDVLLSPSPAHVYQQPAEPTAPPKARRTSINDTRVLPLMNDRSNRKPRAVGNDLAMGERKFDRDQKQFSHGAVTSQKLSMSDGINAVPPPRALTQILPPRRLSHDIKAVPQKKVIEGEKLVTETRRRSNITLTDLVPKQDDEFVGGDNDHVLVRSLTLSLRQLEKNVTAKIETLNVGNNKTKGNTYEKVDAHANSAPVQHSIKNLVNYLLNHIEVTTEITQLRVIYRWMLSYLAPNPDGVVSNKPEDVFTSRRGSSEGIARLMQFMLEAAGIPCLLVSGKVKCWGCSLYPGQKLKDHSWNMVFVKSTWRHIDVASDFGYFFESWSVPNPRQPLACRPQPNFQVYVLDTYFNLLKEDFLQNHFPMKFSAFPNTVVFRALGSRTQCLLKFIENFLLHCYFYC